MHNHAQQGKYCLHIRLSTTTTTRSLPHLVAVHGFVGNGRYTFLQKNCLIVVCYHQLVAHKMIGATRAPDAKKNVHHASQDHTQHNCECILPFE